MTTGAPMSGVTAFSGNKMPDGNTHISEQRRPTPPPVRSVAGIRMLWRSVGKNILAMWGTARPINETGPQNAVITAVSSPVASSKRFLTLIRFTPRFLA